MVKNSPSPDSPSLVFWNKVAVAVLLLRAPYAIAISSSNRRIVDILHVLQFLMHVQELSSDDLS